MAFHLRTSFIFFENFYITFGLFPNPSFFWEPTANALFALINTELEALTDCGDNLESNLTIDYYELIDKSAELCEILQNDFIFAPVGHRLLIHKSIRN